jgi:hypothetical protein
MLLRLRWMPMSYESGARLGTRVIVSDLDAPYDASGAYAPGARPYMAEIIEWGARWEGGGQSGYYALTRELPEGAKLAAEWHERQRRSRRVGQ